jgi:1-acyl-sn-glycerol-3-phosphate acyltransferase
VPDQTVWLSKFLIGLVRIVVGASPRWIGAGPSPEQRIYFANHSSHIDTVALWSALPPELRIRTRPVAAADYWGKSALRRYVVLKGLNAVLIDRSRVGAGADPLQPLAEALEHGDSLILFPEGTRTAQALPGPFKAGLFNLAMRFPEVELVPVYLDNLHRSLPKGTVFPVPLICTVRFGAPLRRVAGEGKDAFLQRARSAVVELA